MNDTERAEIRRQIGRIKEIEETLQNLATSCSVVGLEAMNLVLSEQTSACRSVTGILELLISRNCK